MLRWILMTVCTVMLAGQAQEKQPAEKPADTQPATRPAGSSTTLRKPAQADILKNLLRRDERPMPIRPQKPLPTGEGGEASHAGQPLLLEGAFLFERPGRLVHEDGRAKFVFHADDGTQATSTMEICPNQLLEAMEREVEAGFSEFIVSAEVTRYRGCNYLILRKLLRRVGHGNLSP